MTSRSDLSTAESAASMHNITDQMRSPECVEPHLFLPAEWQALDTKTRQKILDHVVDCPVCQAERAMAEAFADADAAQRTAGTRVPWPAAMAAGVALALGLGLWASDRPSLVPALPDVPQSAATRGGSMNLSTRDWTDIPVFEWSAVTGAVEYRLVATDLTGRVVWTRTTTSPGLSPDLRDLEGVMSWRWSVEAIGPDGTILAASPAMDARTPGFLSNE